MHTILQRRHYESLVLPVYSAEKFFPIINQWFGLPSGWVYFKLRRGLRSFQELTLGAFTVLLAILVDCVGFVLIKKIRFLKRHDFIG